MVEYDDSDMESSASATKKATIVPILPISWDVNSVGPLPILPDRGVFLEDIRKLLTPRNFELWQENLSKNQRTQLSAANVALIHRFESTGHIGKEEQESKSLLDGVTACLRIVRPTSARFQTIQLKYLSDGNVDVFRFTHPHDNPPNGPQSDALNRIRQEDIARLQKVIRPFLRLAGDGPDHVLRAARYFLIGYSEIYEPIAQVLMWVAGIEAMLSHGESSMPPVTPDKLLDVIHPQWNIYEDSGIEEFMGATVRVGDVARDVFDLRNRLAHGGGIPDEWAKKTSRPAFSGSIEYAEMLREASAAILRKLLMDWLVAGRAVS